MTEDELKRRIEEVLADSDDNERAHELEDELHRDVIAAFCPDWVVTHIKALSAAPFARWYA